MDFELWFYSYFWGDFGIDCMMVLCHVFDMFCSVFVACFVASIGSTMWPVDKGCSEMGSGQKLACVSELPRSSLSLARWCVEAMLLRGWAQNCSSLARSCVESTLLRGWAQNCSPRVRNCVGFQAIA